MARSRRLLAAPFLITLSALPACAGPVYRNPPPLPATPPDDAAAPPATTADVDAAPAPPPVATAGTTSSASYETDVRPPLPEPNAAAHHYRNADGTCWETWMAKAPKPCPTGKKCPPQPTFNPPPPRQVKCL